MVPPVERRWEYRVYREENEVQDIVEEYEDLGELQYLVRFWNGQESEVSESNRPYPINGQQAISYIQETKGANEYTTLGILYSASHISKWPHSSKRIQ